MTTEDKIARLRALSENAKRDRDRHPRNSPGWLRCQYRVYMASAATVRTQKGVGS